MIIRVLKLYLGLLYSNLKNALRIFKLRSKGVVVGRGCRIASNFICGKGVKIGDYTYIGQNVELGDRVKIGGFVALKNIKVDDNSHIEANVRVIGPGKGSITIGKESYIGFNITLDTSSSIHIGDFVHIGSSLWSHSSAKQVIEGLPLADKNTTYRPTYETRVENNVYLGINSAISPGITIGNHSIVSPNSAVTKDVEPYSIVGGVPAKLIRKLE
jgi:acetyltransferase-like isoleucine patch superfamily enzyme